MNIIHENNLCCFYYSGDESVFIEDSCIRVSSGSLRFIPVNRKSDQNHTFHLTEKRFFEIMKKKIKIELVIYSVVVEWPMNSGFKSRVTVFDQFMEVTGNYRQRSWFA